MNSLLPSHSLVTTSLVRRSNRFLDVEQAASGSHSSFTAPVSNRLFSSLSDSASVASSTDLPACTTVDLANFQDSAKTSLLVRLSKDPPASSADGSHTDPAESSPSLSEADHFLTPSDTVTVHLQKPLIMNFRKHKLLKRCHRQLKRLLRSPRITPDTASELNSQCDAPHGCQKCSVNSTILIDLQTKYSDLSSEVASLKRQLVAVQHAFTSLRTMLLASFPTSFDHAKSTGDFSVNPSANSFDSNVLVSATNSCAEIVNAFRLDNTRSCDLPVSSTSIIVPPTVSCAPCSSVTFPMAVNLQVNTLHTQTPYMTLPTFSYSPAATNMSDISSADVPVSGAVRDSTVSNTNLPYEVNDFFPSTFTSVTDNETHLPTLNEASPVVLNPELIQSKTEALEARTIFSVSKQFDTFLLVEAVRNSMLALNVSQRRLSRELDGVRQKTISDLLRKPKPWSQLTPHARTTYERMYNWLLSLQGSKINCLKDATSTSSLTSVARSVQSNGASPWTLSGTGDTPISEHVLEDMYLSGEPVPMSPFEASVSPNSFSSAPIVDSTNLLNSDSESTKRAPFECTQPATVSTADRCEPISNEMGTCVSSDAGISRRFPSTLDTETQKRIKDILSAARIAMAQEKSEEIIQVVDVHQDNGMKSGVRKRRTASAESTGRSRRVSKVEEDETRTEVHRTDSHIMITMKNPLLVTSLTSASITAPTSTSPPSDRTNEHISIAQLSTSVSAARSTQSVPTVFPAPPVVMSTSIAQSLWSGVPKTVEPCSLATPSVHGLVGHIPLSVAGSMGHTAPQTVLSTSHDHIPDFLQLLTVQQSGPRTFSIVTPRGEHITLPVTAVQLGRAPDPLSSLAHHRSTMMPQSVNPSNQPAPLNQVTSFPILTPTVSDGTVVSAVNSVSQLNLAVPSPPLPNLVSLGRMSMPVLPQPLGNLMSPLQQTLILLAAAANANTSTSISNLPKNDAPSNSVVSSCLDTVNAVVSCSQQAQMNITCPSNPSRDLFSGEPGLIVFSQSGNSFDMPVTTVPLTVTNCSATNLNRTSNACTMDDATLKLLSTIDYQQLTASQLKQFSDCISPLDTFDLSTRVKNHLRELNVSQRMFGELVLGMCQASVSDILNKPRQWDVLSPRSRLAYLRLYTWLQQPDRAESIKLAQANHRQRLRNFLSDYQSLNLTSSEVISNQDNGPNTQSVVDPTQSPGARKRDAITSQLACTGSTIPSKLMRSDPLGSDETVESSKSIDQLAEHERQSLFDIARAATVAMQRGNSANLMRFVKTKSESPVKIPALSRSTTPLKTEPSAKLARGTELTDSMSKMTGSSPEKMSPGRYRVVFTPEQKDALVTSFSRQPYPSSERLREIARELDLTYKTVLNWFHNRRMRSRPPMLASMGRTNCLGSSHVDERKLPTRNCEQVFSATMAGPALDTVDGAQPQPVHHPRHHETYPVAQFGHQNRRKRPDPSRLITPCL
ncbi:hypothetical protein EG68_05860 [Paragonimus skrjabini miyazakii]|uniref:DNA-binding protein SATB n=1 Tax=Paragonimus skrjabini miyazakii TaxID=59628 RepID=A0A8S9YVR5_9TREM|nr:hypothetical protein EG68_05860 [Paragonimus skrjabini miyazakii]